MRIDLLKDYQVEPAQRLDVILQSRNALDCSDTGTGKTFVAMACAQHRQGPTLAIVPKISITAWRRVAHTFGIKEFNVVNYEALRTGRSGFGTWENQPPKGFRSEAYFTCQCCQRVVDIDDTNDKCYAHPLGIHCVERKKKAWDYGRFLWTIRRDSLIVMDEIHRCSGIDSLNADMLIGARSSSLRVLGLSATAACTPLQMRALGYTLDLHTLSGSDTGFYPWAMRHGCGKIPMLRGLHFTAGEERQGKIMEKIHEDLFPSRGVRIKKSEVPNFPKCHIFTELIDFEDTEKLNQIYVDLVPILARLDERSAQDASAENPLTILLRARQRIELLKISATLEMVHDYLDQGYSIAVFLNFTETIRELARRLGDLCCVLQGVGSAKEAEERQASIDAFTNDDKRVILCNSEAAGESVSLEDRRGKFPRGGIVMPPLSARTLRQIFGRLNRSSSMSPCWYKVLLAANTVEEKVKRNLDRKGNNLDSLNDGDLNPITYDT